MPQGERGPSVGAVEDYLRALAPSGVQLGLHRMQSALGCLGRPDRRLRVLLVAGTNGKGSTCAMAAAALQAAGHKVGLYTSPHLHHFSERIRVDGRPVPSGELVSALEAVRDACPWQDDPSHEDKLTHFELATLLGLISFARREVGIAVIETGLGGALDATAVLRPRAIAMTRISVDHREFFGDAVEEVARAEASIFKPGVPVVLAPDQPPRALDVLRAEAERVDAPLSICSGEYTGPLSLRGAHQRQNAALARGALDLLARDGLVVPDAAARAALAGARWPGRLEEIEGVLLDVAHNPDGARVLSDALRDLYPGRPVDLVFGVMADKDCREMLRSLAVRVRHVHLCPALTSRALAPGACASIAASLGVTASLHSTCTDALESARRAAGATGLVCVTGSFSVVAEVRGALLAGDRRDGDGDVRWD